MGAGRSMGEMIASQGADMWADYLDKNQDRFIQDLADFIRIPSVSALDHHVRDVVAAGHWVIDRMKAAGMENTQMLQTAGHPVVYGDWLHAGADKPTVLIYGHFDVQPAEPFELWDSPAFEPEIRDGRIYGRGASDDKGGMMIPIIAAEALLNTEGKLPVNVKFFFEGQEEIGSPHLPDFIRENSDLLRADMIFSADGGQWSETEPQMVVALKGVVGFDMHVQAAGDDLHSGMHGGGVANPIDALSRIITSFKTPDGKIAVQGFYDDVVDLTIEDRAEIARVPFDEAEYLAETGAPAVFGEPGYTTRERIWARPTLELNGITGGWQGPGTKTVLPAAATAKITCRLVANQTPDQIHALIKAHVVANTPPGVIVTVNPPSGRGDPFMLPHGHNASAVAAQVLTEIYGKAPYVTRVGGSIPVMGMFLRELGVHTTMFAFGLADENQHAPNEFYRLDEFRLGQDAYCKLLHKLA